MTTSYTIKTLGNGETILHVGEVHWSIWFLPAFVFTAGSISSLALSSLDVFSLGFFVSLLLVAHAAVLQRTTEMVITNQRLIMRQGLLRRTSLELQLTHVGVMQLDQDLTGRLLDYGTLAVQGVSVSSVAYLKQPFAFRNRLHEAIQTRMSKLGTAQGGAALAAAE